PAPAAGSVPGAPGGEAVTAASRDQAIAATKRVKIDTQSLEGSINLTGARLDDLKLKHYTETVDKNSPEIELLNPSSLPNGYFAEIGFVGN
ncbi:MAG: membrane protein insertase YidC, partial [Mesorhizobium sp.]